MGIGNNTREANQIIKETETDEKKRKRDQKQKQRKNDCCRECDECEWAMKREIKSKARENCLG